MGILKVCGFYRQFCKQDFVTKSLRLILTFSFTILDYSKRQESEEESFGSKNWNVNCQALTWNNSVNTNENTNKALYV